MKLYLDISLQNIILQKFEWDCTYLKITLNIKNNYPIKIKLKNLKINLLNSVEKKFIYISSDNILVKSHHNADIDFNIIIYNKEVSNLISDFVNLKKSDFRIHIISGKLKVFSVIPVNLKDKRKDMDILDIIKYLCRS